jgi:hypothetical protein
MHRLDVDDERNRRAISPVWFMPISTTQRLASGRALHSVSGTPQKLLKLAGLA